MKSAKKFPSLPKPPNGDDLDAELQRHITSAPGKLQHPWRGVAVRDDLMVQVNVKQPERLMLKLSWLAREEGRTKRDMIEEALEHYVDSKLKLLGVPL